MSTREQSDEPLDDEQRLHEEIERTREQLGETVEALAAKADVKAQAQAAASRLTGRVKGTAGQAGRHAATRASRVRTQLGDTAATAQSKAKEAAGPAVSQARQRAADAASAATQALPQSARQGAARAANAARQRWTVLLAAAVGFTAVVALYAARRRRRG